MMITSLEGAFMGFTPSHVRTRHVTGSTIASKAFERWRVLASLPVFCPNRDKNRVFWIPTVTKTVTEKYLYRDRSLHLPAVKKLYSFHADETVYPHWSPALRAVRQRAIEAKTWDPEAPKPARPPSELHPLVQFDRLIQQRYAPEEFPANSA